MRRMHGTRPREAGQARPGPARESVTPPPPRPAGVARLVARIPYPTGTRARPSPCGHVPRQHVGGGRAHRQPPLPPRPRERRQRDGEGDTRGTPRGQRLFACVPICRALAAPQEQGSRPRRPHGFAVGGGRHHGPWARAWGVKRSRRRTLPFRVSVPMDGCNWLDFLKSNGPKMCSSLIAQKFCTMSSNPMI